MILATRGRGVKFPHLYRPSHLCVGFYPRREDFHPTPEASGPSVVSNSDSSHPLQQTPNVLYQVRDSSGSKKVQEIKMSKMFIILNLLTLPGRSTSRTVTHSYSGAWTDCIYTKYRMRCGCALPATPILCTRQRRADRYAS